MVPKESDVLCLRFGAFELDLVGNELRRGGTLIKLSPQQFRLLCYLAENSGVICSRGEIQRNLWGNEVFVDFDRGLNVHIAQLRAALKDNSEAPRFIQTIPRQGYRFVAPVEHDTGAKKEASTEQPSKLVAGWRRYRRYIPYAVAAAFFLSVATAYLWRVEKVKPRTMLAVLPFENLTGQAELGPIIDGLTDELITEFGTIQPERLGVIARTSVMSYRGRNVGIPEIGRELGVDYVIEGSIRQEDTHLRISARLIKASGQVQVWNQTFELNGPGRLELQEQLAARVSAAVVKELFPGATGPPAHAHSPNAEAYDAFVNGRYLQRNNPEDPGRAVASFEQAAKLDSAFADPLASLAELNVGLALSGAHPPAEAFTKARAYAVNALRIDDGNAQAQNALADVCFWQDWNWSEARHHFLRALAINPSLSDALHDYAIYLIVTDRPEEGLTSLRRAIALDPLSPKVNIDAGWLLLQAHHYDEAIAQANRALQLRPGMREASACIARAEQYKGKGTPRVNTKALTSGDPYQRALFFATQGRKDEAVKALESSYEEHSFLMPLIKSEPAFLDLHSDPQYREIIRKMGL